MLYVLRSWPSSELSCRWYARSRCRGQGQGVRAGEPVRAPESRCSGAPPFNARADRTGQGERELVTPPRYSLGGPCKPTRERQGLPLRLSAGHWLLRESGEGIEGLVRWRLRGCRGQSSTTQICRRCRDGPMHKRRARASGSKGRCQSSRRLSQAG